MNNECGSVLMEAILCLPVLLLLSLGVAQFAHIWLCRTMVHYAAFSAARAALVASNGTETEQAFHAAKAVCAPIAYFDPAGNGDLTLPGIGEVSGSGAVGKTDNGILEVTAQVNNSFHVHVDVKMKVPLLVPVAGPVIGQVMSLWGEKSGAYKPESGKPKSGGPAVMLSNDLFPRLVLHEQVYMARPFLITWKDN